MRENKSNSKTNNNNNGNKKTNNWKRENQTKKQNAVCQFKWKPPESSQKDFASFHTLIKNFVPVATGRHIAL